MLAAAATLAGVLAVPFVWGQSSGTNQANPEAGRSEKHFRHGGHHGRHGRFFRGLNLTDAQKDQMKQINRDFRERTQSLRAELRTKRQELRQAQTGETFNEALATQKLTEMASLDAKLMGERFKVRQQMAAVLTPEQKAQLQQRREEFKQKREEFKAKQN